MKKLRMIALSYALLGICLLVGCNAADMSSLKDISRPYAGEYKCRKLQLGGEDFLERFDSVKLNLTYGGKFRFEYEDAFGNENAYEGKYKVSEAHKTVTLSSNARGEEETYVFPYVDGRIIMELLMNEKLLYAEFSMVE